MSCPHRIVEVEDFTGLGAHVRCCSCGRTYHASESVLETSYIPFTHTSPEDPRLDRCIFIKLDFLESKNV